MVGATGGFPWMLSSILGIIEHSLLTVNVSGHYYFTYYFTYVRRYMPLYMYMPLLYVYIWVYVSACIYTFGLRKGGLLGLRGGFGGGGEIAGYFKPCSLSVFWKDNAIHSILNVSVLYFCLWKIMKNCSLK